VQATRSHFHHAVGLAADNLGAVLGETHETQPATKNRAWKKVVTELKEATGSRICGVKLAKCL
ncbi:MAG: hypothetical protein WB869_13360, partial [Candidatus Acidiferrales bacterium]